MSKHRVIALVDMDTFYTQVEERERPELRNKPLAVVQMGPNGTNGLSIAVNYQARVFGVKRGQNDRRMRQLCPDLNICRVPAIEGIEKGDLQKYRNASNEVFEVLSNTDLPILVEKASVDEAYLDLTEACELELSKYSTTGEFVDKLLAGIDELLCSTFLVNGEDRKDPSSSGRRLDDLKEWLDKECRADKSQLAIAAGAMFLRKIRQKILDVTKFTCSAGIGQNKMMAKLVCARHKPCCQSIIVSQYLSKLYEETPIQTVRFLGGKFGLRLLERFGVKTMADLQMVPYEQIMINFPKDAVWLSRLLEGEDDEPIRARVKPKSIGVSKNFPGQSALNTISSIKKWIQCLTAELYQRLKDDEAKFGRSARSIVITFAALVEDGKEDANNTSSKTFALPNCTVTIMEKICWNFMRPFNKEIDHESWYPPLRHIQIIANKFETMQGRSYDIAGYFAQASGKLQTEKSIPAMFFEPESSKKQPREEFEQKMPPWWVLKTNSKYKDEYPSVLDWLRTSKFNANRWFTKEQLEKYFPQTSNDGENFDEEITIIESSLTNRANKKDSGSMDKEVLDMTGENEWNRREVIPAAGTSDVLIIKTSRTKKSQLRSKITFTFDEEDEMDVGRQNQNAAQNLANMSGRQLSSSCALSGTFAKICNSSSESSNMNKEKIQKKKNIGNKKEKAKKNRKNGRISQFLRSHIPSHSILSNSRTIVVLDE